MYPSVRPSTEPFIGTICVIMMKNITNNDYISMSPAETMPLGRCSRRKLIQMALGRRGRQLLLLVLCVWGSTGSTDVSTALSCPLNPLKAQPCCSSPGCLLCLPPCWPRAMAAASIASDLGWIPASVMNDTVTPVTSN